MAPPNPFRCPPGPYERAAQIAHYLKLHKPKSKVIILDAKDNFSKQGLFENGWKQYYGSMIEWVSGAAGGNVEAVDAAAMTVQAQIEQFKGDVINVIPAPESRRHRPRSGPRRRQGVVPHEPADLRVRPCTRTSM
ncbi:MAG: hypothetical protein MZW92_50270 [Comamonadaceae bacterium]|nr:hypothetical protein [Comamonadaceae bacterium]